eukprot:6193353-Pleurochrysis_carterae.AAC.7
MSVPEDTGIAGTPSEPFSIGLDDLLVSPLGDSEIPTRRSGPRRSSSHSDERSREKQGDGASSASIPVQKVRSLSESRSSGSAYGRPSAYVLLDHWPSESVPEGTSLSG